jgi:hypothetical protein
MTRKNRCILVAGLLAVGVCLTLAVLVLLPPRPGVTKANYDRIEEGMSLAEINAILGRPPDMVEGGAEEMWHGWIGEDGFVHVVFAGDSTFVRKEWRDSPRTLSEKVRQWLHLP